MNDDKANWYVDQWYAAIMDAETIEARRRQIRLLVKEVERDARYLAIEAIQRCANEVSNLSERNAAVAPELRATLNQFSSKVQP